jgi:hypothetical protein
MTLAERSSAKVRYAKVIGGENKGMTVEVYGVAGGKASCFPALDRIERGLYPSIAGDQPVKPFEIDVEELQFLTFGPKQGAPTPDCLLSRAIALAAEKHAGQFDQGGQPYILHPLRVMAMLESLEEKIVAVLHDIVEDTDVTLVDLRCMGFTEEIVRGVESVTHIKDKEDYFDYVRRAQKNRIGAKVKAADLRDNLSVNRLTLDGRDEARHLRYIKALRILEGHLT